MHCQRMLASIKGSPPRNSGSVHGEIFIGTQFASAWTTNVQKITKRGQEIEQDTLGCLCVEKEKETHLV